MSLTFTTFEYHRTLDDVQVLKQYLDMKYLLLSLFSLILSLL
jgi:hypothetical protein